MERAVEAGTLGEESEIGDTLSVRASGAESFHLTPGESFYVVLTSEKLVFADPEQSNYIVHDLPEALSPDLRWLTYDAGELPGSVVNPLASPESTPFAPASRCDLVRAWSSNGSTLLCSSQTGVVTYTLSEQEGALDGVELNVPDHFPGESLRMAFSGTGSWLAMVPDQGLVVVPAAEYATRNLDVPDIEPAPEGTPEWDFFFTPAEDRLIVQRGRALVVLTLANGAVSDRWQVEGIELPQVPGCTNGRALEPDMWCGAPKFRGNVLLSPVNRHLAFIDRFGEVHIVDLVERRVYDLGPASDSHEPSLKFL